MADRESLNRQTGTRSYGSTMDTAEIGFAGPSSSSTTDQTFDQLAFNRLCDQTTTNIFSIAKHATSLERTLKTIGTRNDTDALRDSVHTVTTTALKSIGETTATLRSLTTMVQQIRGGGTGGGEFKLRVTKLTTDFKMVVQKFTDTQKQIVAKMKTSTPVTSGFLDSEDHKQSLVDAEAAQQQQLQYQQHLEFEQGLLIEREDRVRQIEADIVDVNDIMRELATLVVEQRSVVDSIEGNIDETYTQVETGRAELQKAETYQSTYRKRLFCLLGVGLTILVVVIIILVTQLKKS